MDSTVPQPEPPSPPEPAPDPAPEPQPVTAPPPPDEAQLRAARRQFRIRLGEFRRAQVLVPLGPAEGPDEVGAPLSGESGGLRWLYAFSDEQALTRWALARGEGDREYNFLRVQGAWLLDAAVPSAESPCGVVLDAADGPDALLLPPVTGIVPDAAAVDVPGAFPTGGPGTTVEDNVEPVRGVGGAA